MKTIALLIAAATVKPTTDPAPPWFQAFSSQYVIIGAVLLMTFLFMGKGKKNEEKARVAMLKQLKRGDRIQTIGGIQGAVTRAEESRVEVKVDEASNTKIWFARSAIARVIDGDEKAETK